MRAASAIRAAAIALVAGAAETRPAAADEDPVSHAAGTWTTQIYAGHNFGDGGKGEMWSGHLGIGYHVWDDLGLHLDAFGAFVRSGIDDDGAAFGADLIGRWHVLAIAGGGSSLFLDAGVGFQQASTNYSGSRHFNFRLHPGFGAALETRWLRLLAGARYLHISDAGMSGTGGGGFDGFYLYLGTSFTPWAVR